MPIDRRFARAPRGGLLALMAAAPFGLINTPRVEHFGQSSKISSGTLARAYSAAASVARSHKVLPASANGAEYRTCSNCSWQSLCCSRGAGYPGRHIRSTFYEPNGILPSMGRRFNENREPRRSV